MDSYSEEYDKVKTRRLRLTYRFKGFMLGFVMGFMMHAIVAMFMTMFTSKVPVSFDRYYWGITAVIMVLVICYMCFGTDTESTRKSLSLQIGMEGFAAGWAMTSMVIYLAWIYISPFLSS
jgi:cytochrome c biogenesis protein CcdA